MSAASAIGLVNLDGSMLDGREKSDGSNVWDGDVAVVVFGCCCVCDYLRYVLSSFVAWLIFVLLSRSHFGLISLHGSPATLVTRWTGPRTR